MGVTKEQAKASQQAAFKKEASAQASGATAGGSPVGETSAQKAARQATTGGQTEAQKQAELHGLTTGGQFKEQTQQQFEQMSPALQREYNRQAEESQRAAMRRQAKEELGKPPAKYDDPEFAAAYEAGKGGRSKSEDKVIEETNVFRGSEAEYQEYVREFEEQNRIATEQNKKIEKELDEFSKSFLNIGGATVPASLVLPAEENLEKRVEAYNKFIAGYNVQQEKYYETKIKETAKGIVSEAKAKGATKIKIYTKEGEPLGSIGVVGAEEPIATQLRTGEFQVGYYVPKTAEQKAEYEKYKEEEKKFKVFVSKYKEIGATFDITKDGKLIGVTSKEHPYYDIKKAQREGEVSVSPTKVDYITGQRLREVESGDYAHIAGTVGYNLGEFIYYAPESMREAIETTPKDATLIDRFTKGYSPKTTLKTELHAQRDIGWEYALTGKIPKGFTQQDVDIALQANLGLALAGAGVKGGPKKSPKDFTGVDIAKRVKVPETPKLTKTVYRPTNVYREPLPKDLFEFDTAKTPAGSATQEIPPKPFFESGQEAVAQARKSSEKLLEPIKPKVEKPIEPKEPAFENILGRRGQPPIKSTVVSEQTKPRAEVVEETRPLLGHEVFTPKGEKIGTFGETKPIGALAKGTKKPLGVQEVKGYKPDISEFYIRPKKIDTERLLDIEQPSIGEPKSFTDDLGKLGAKQPEKPKPTKKPEQAFRKFIFRTEGELPKTGEKEIPSKSGQVLIQKTKVEQEAKLTKQLAAKPIGKKIERRAITRPLIVTEQREEEIYLHKDRPRPTTKTTLTTKQKLVGEERLVTKTSLSFATKIKTGLTERPKTETLTFMEAGQPQKEKQKQTPKLTPRFTQDMPTPQRPKTKPALAQPLAQKQPQKLVPVEIVPLKPKRILIFEPEFPGVKARAARPRKEKLGLRADFLGGAPESRLEGIYKERDITYGQKRINRLLAKEERGKSRFGSVGKVSLFKEKPKRVKIKKERMSKIF